MKPTVGVCNDAEKVKQFKDEALGETDAVVDLCELILKWVDDAWYGSLVDILLQFKKRKQFK